MTWAKIKRWTLNWLSHPGAALIKIIIDKKQPFLLKISIELEIPTSVIRPEEDAKGIWIGKEDVKLSLCIDDTIIFIGNPKELTWKLLEVIGKVSEYKVNKKKKKSVNNF